MNFEDIKEGTKFYTIENNMVVLLEAIEQKDLNAFTLWKCKYLSALKGDRIKTIHNSSELFDNDYDAYLHLYDDLYYNYKSVGHTLYMMENGQISINRV